MPGGQYFPCFQEISAQMFPRNFLALPIFPVLWENALNSKKFHQNSWRV